MKDNIDSVTRNKIIDTLLDLRLSLSIKKITSPKIKKSEFKKMLDDINENEKDKLVSDSINELFSEYFDNKKDEKDSLNINEIQNMIENDSQFKDGQSKSNGSALIKRDGHFNSNGVETNQAV